MSVEKQEFERYLEYQRSQRDRRAETLGNVVTVLALSTIDLGLSPVGRPESAPTQTHSSEVAPEPEVIHLAEPRRRQLGAFAVESAELGYAVAA